MKLNKLSAPRVRRVVKCFGLFAAALAMFVMLPAFATMQSKSDIKTGNLEQSARELFSFIESPDNSSTASIAAVREQAIKIDFGKINFESTQELKIPLLDGITYKAVRTESEGFVHHTIDEFTWRGKISGENNWSGDVILTVKGKALSGLIYSPTAVYEVIPQADFTHLLVELDQSRFPDSIEVAPPSEQRDGTSIVKKNALEESTFGGNTLLSPLFQNGSVDSPQLDDGSMIDVLVVYTAAVRNALGGATQAQALAQQSVASTNTTYQNSGITTRLRLVQTMEVNYADNGNVQVALDWVRTNATVATARNTAKADLVSMLTENANDACGIGYAMSNVSQSSESIGFSVVQRTCAVANLTFAHELGHNQGCYHNPENSNGTPAYPYSYGHWSISGNFRTVMSYTDPCPSCPRIPNFSNPSVSRNGVPTGITNQRENARTINNTALTVSRFRDSSLIPGTPPPATRRVFDFDGDGKSDVSVFRPSNGTWHILQSQNGLTGGPFGQNGDRIAPADYDGDGKTDVAVFRGTVPGAGNYAYFYIINSSDSSVRPVQFGATGDVPVSGDWDGDGKADVAVYRDGSLTGGQSYFYYRPSSAPGVNFRTIAWGTNGDKPLVGDFDGDRRLDAAVFRPSNGTWYILRSSNNQSIQEQFGVATDVPTPVDLDGDGITNMAVFRPSTGTWYTSLNPAINYGPILFGTPGDLPIPADYDGDGKTDIAVYRPSNGWWYLLRSTSGFTGVLFGNIGDKPIPNAFIP